MENAKETYVLKMDHIVKEYFGNRVLKGVDLAVRPGEIHALMGEKRRRKIHPDEYPVWYAGHSQHRRF